MKFGNFFGRWLERTLLMLAIIVAIVAVVAWMCLGFWLVATMDSWVKAIGLAVYFAITAGLVSALDE